MKNPRLDVIIVNFNSTDYAIRCIDSIYQSIPLYELHITVVDNCSKDRPERIKQSYPDIDLVINKKNLGFSKAVNIALARVPGELLVLLNPDTVVYDGFFNNVINYINDNKDVAIVGPKIFDPDGTVQGSARRFPTVLTSIFGRKSPLTKIFPNNPVSKREFLCFNGNGKKPMEVDWVSGACMVARKKALDAVGWFDESYFLYWEDTDLCKRLKDSGWKIMYYPDAEICHYIGKSSDRAPIFSIYHFHKSCYMLYSKYARLSAKIMMPLAVLGLSTRCIMVMGLNRFHRLKDRKKKTGERLKATGRT